MWWITSSGGLFSVRNSINCGPSLAVLAFFLTVCLSTSGVHIASRVSESDSSISKSHPQVVDNQDELRRDATRNKGISVPIPLPSNFGEKVEAGLRMAKEIYDSMSGSIQDQRRRHGDPAPIPAYPPPRGTMEQGRSSAGQGRGFFSFWPFSIEITKGKGDGPSFGHGGVQGGWGPSIFKGITFKAASHHHKGHDDGHHHGHHDEGGGGGGGGHEGHHGWGWEAAIEKEKHQLRYEILKLKAKKKIALLQNTVELKKLCSIILQKFIQALEWWR